MNPNEAASDVAVTQFVSAFVALRQRGNVADLNECVPRRDHPQFARIRREILLADMKCAWQAGHRRLVLDYVSVFPDLLEDAVSIDALAFAEFRLRQLAGEDPTPVEYEWQFDLVTTDWSARVLAGEGASGLLPADSDPKTEISPMAELAGTRIVAPPSSDASAKFKEAPDCEVSSRLFQEIDELPAVGTRFLDFHLVAELGRGRFGRVYLARQGDLANRLVALKITVDLPGEEQKLAQLQHTNVVPIYSYHQSGELHAVCMPYFGATTLADIVRVFQILVKAPATGKMLVDTVQIRRSAFRTHVVPAESNNQSSREGVALPGLPVAGIPDLADEDEVPVTLTLLEQASYVDAVLWIAERLTEGLIHAHEHGILHRDLKPANILLTDDGVPMLLDFNLSADTKPDALLQERRVGGTLPYMAPEVLASLADGPKKVDERSDLYAIGVILYELLTGRVPFAGASRPLSSAIPTMVAERMKPPPLVRPWNPTVPFAVESIVRHCLEPDLKKRYQSARQLRDDLKRQRQHRPLRHAPEPSFRERLHKWSRRHPRLVSPASLGTIAALVLLLSLAPLSWQTWKEWEKRNKERDQALIESRKDIESARDIAARQAAALRQFREFQKSLGSARLVMESINAIQVLPRFMKAWTIEESNLQRHMAKCRASLEHYAVLQDPAWQSQPRVKFLTPGDRDQLNRHVVELLFVLAEGERVRAARPRVPSHTFVPLVVATGMLGIGQEAWVPVWCAEKEALLPTARILNERARQCCKGELVPRAVLIQQAELARERGAAQQAKKLLELAESSPLCPGTPDAFWTASALAAQGNFKQALPLLEEVVRETPDHYGAWLLRGICLTPQFSIASLREDRSDRQKAFECFTTCIVMQPDRLWAYYLRGLVNYQLYHYANAIADFDRLLDEKVLNRQPAFATAYVQRAAALEDNGELERAEEELTKAIKAEPNVPEYYFQRARVREKLHGIYKKQGIREKLNKLAEAQHDKQKVLNSVPENAEGWIYRGMVREEKDPRGALADYDVALAIDPDDPLALFRKGRLQAGVLNRPKDAVVTLDRALALKPDYADARILRGRAHAMLGNRSLAHKDADAVLYSNPTPKDHYHIARVYAITSREHPKDALYALGMLAHALRFGYGVQSYRTEPDFAALRKLPEFDSLGIGLRYLNVTP